MSDSHYFSLFLTAVLLIDPESPIVNEILNMKLQALLLQCRTTSIAMC